LRKNTGCVLKYIVPGSNTQRLCSVSSHRFEDIGGVIFCELLINEQQDNHTFEIRSYMLWSKIVGLNMVTPSDKHESKCNIVSQASNYTHVCPNCQQSLQTTDFVSILFSNILLCISLYEWDILIIIWVWGKAEDKG